MTPDIDLPIIDQPADFLLIGGGFFGYAHEIVNALKRRGRVAIWYEDRPSLDTFTKSAIRLAPWLVRERSERYFDRIISRVRNLPIREVLIIKAESVSPTSIERLRTALPKARFTLYFWDSYANMSKDSPRKVPLFDRAFTFDPDDALADPLLTYRPLFYLDEYAHLPSREIDTDLLFIGTAHSDRYSVIKRLRKNLPSQVRMAAYLYFPSRLVHASRRTFDFRLWNSRREEFIFQPLTKAEVKRLIASSRAIIDIERASQRGLTIRTIEVFGAGKKLLTTNPRIQDEEIFHPNNIALIDRHEPRIEASFLSSPYTKPTPDLLQRYSLQGWLDEVLQA